MIYGNCITMTGESHFRMNGICQDSSGYYSSGAYTIVVVADGHGSDEYYRSDVGSKIAVFESIRVLRDALASNHFINQLKEDSDSILRELGNLIIDSWVESVTNYDTKYSICDNRDDKNAGDILTKYGTTLVIGVLFDDFSFGFQVGDGDIYGITETGHVINNIIEKDSRCYDNITTSLCNADVKHSIRHFYIKTGMLKSILVSTDGFTTCYQNNEDANKIVRQIVSKFDVRGAWNHDVARLINDCSKKARCDDVSISVAYSDEMSGLLLESLCTMKIPQSKHKHFLTNVMEIKTSGSLESSNYYHCGWSYDGMYFKEGIFQNGLLVGIGLLKYPSVNHTIKGALVQLLAGNGLYWFGSFEKGVPVMKEKHHIIEVEDGICQIDGKKKHYIWASDNIFLLKTIQGYLSTNQIEQK